MHQAIKRNQMAALGFGLLLVVGATGCQSDFGGQTLPSPWWLTDDVQYFAPGPEFKLSREAAAMRAAKANAALNDQGGGGMGMGGGMPGGMPGAMPMGAAQGGAVPIPPAPGPVVPPAAAP